MPIVSLRPEDSISYGYVNPESWHKLIESHRDEIAREFRIPASHFKWVVAYHNATNEDGYTHNHIHMIIWSTNPNDGWQSTMTGSIKDFPSQADNAVCVEFTVFASALADTKGRKYYKYLPKEQKLMVDNTINDLVNSDDCLKQMLGTWAEAKDNQIKIYSNGEYILPPISEIKEFNGVKNVIVNQAVAYNKDVQINARINNLEAKEKTETSARNSIGNIGLAIASRLAHTLEKPHKNCSPHQKRIKDAEAIDEQVRRSQDMK